MKKISLLLTLILLSTPIAGCVENGDGPAVDVSAEDLQYIFEENFDDFVNNTTITVNQDVNYYNNTSVQQPSSMKSSSGTMAGLETVDTYPIGLALLVRGDRYDAASAGNSADGLNGANLCVGIGTAMEEELQEYFSSEGIGFTSVPVADSAEATQKFRDGECDAMAIGSIAQAEEKKTQLDNDSTWTNAPSEGIWVASIYDGTTDSPGLVGNSISIIINQSSDEMITGLEYFLAQITLFATCKEGTTDCNDIEQILSPLSTTYEMETTCSHNVTFSWAASDFVGGQDPRFQGHGLDCIHSLNLHVSIMPANMQGYDSGAHELSWGDWVYSVIWESIPLQQND